MNKLIIALLLISGMGQSSLMAEEAPEHNDHIEWTQALQDEFGIKTTIIGPGVVQKIRELPGELDFHLDYLAHVTSRYSGVVKAIYKHVGDTVKKGDVLAIVESNDSLTQYSVKAPISGVVFEKHLTLGESIPDSTEIFKIADTSHLWVNFNVFSNLSSKVKVGTPITIQNSEGKTIKAKVSYVSPVLSKETRTLKARADIRTRSSEWSSGMFVTVYYPLDSVTGTVVVPKSAIQRIGDKWVVFVKEGSEIEPHFVTLGEEDAENVIVLSGLQSGQEVISEGSFILKAEREKESFGDGHGH
jgi:membrane fusion protein, heavy metal efflux system